jgi:hypothetical protein
MASTGPGGAPPMNPNPLGLDQTTIAAITLGAIAFAIVIVAIVLAALAFTGQSNSTKTLTQNFSGPIATTAIAFPTRQTAGNTIALYLPAFTIASATATAALTSDKLPAAYIPAQSATVTVQGVSVGTPATFQWTIDTTGILTLQFTNNGVFGAGNAYSVGPATLSYNTVTIAHAF